MRSIQRNHADGGLEATPTTTNESHDPSLEPDDARTFHHRRMMDRIVTAVEAVAETAIHAVTGSEYAANENHGTIVAAAVVEERSGAVVYGLSEPNEVRRAKNENQEEDSSDHHVGGNDANEHHHNEMNHMDVVVVVVVAVVVVDVANVAREMSEADVAVGVVDSRSAAAIVDDSFAMLHVARHTHTHPAAVYVADVGVDHANDTSHRVDYWHRCDAVHGAATSCL